MIFSEPLFGVHFVRLYGGSVTARFRFFLSGKRKSASRLVAQRLCEGAGLPSLCDLIAALGYHQDSWAPASSGDTLSGCQPGNGSR